MQETLAIPVNDEAFHRIALARLEDPLVLLERRWRAKYHQPPRPFEDYTVEELYVEFLEDHYSEHRNEADARRAVYAQDQPQVFGTGGPDGGWDGKLPEDMEQARQEFWAKRRAKHPHTQVDLERFKSDEAMTPEKAAEYLARVGRSAPPPEAPAKPVKLAEGEFEERY